MYIPNHFLQRDKIQIINFMKHYSFATIVSLQDNLPVATHLPFVISVTDNDVSLISHFARANKQWEEIEEQQSMVIFSGPNAYISATHYENELNVPTWNYAAVHAYGKVKIISSDKEIRQVLEKTIQYYDPAYLEQWQQLPDKFKRHMINGIVAFELQVTELQAKYKLSQNRTATERKLIIEFLKSKNSPEAIVGNMMEELHL